MYNFGVCLRLQIYIRDKILFCQSISNNVADLLYDEQEYLLKQRVLFWFGLTISLGKKIDLFVTVSIPYMVSSTLNRVASWMQSTLDVSLYRNPLYPPVLFIIIYPLILSTCLRHRRLDV